MIFTPVMRNAEVHFAKAWSGSAPAGFLVGWPLGGPVGESFWLRKLTLTCPLGGRQDTADYSA